MGCAGAESALPLDGRPVDLGDAAPAQQDQNGLDLLPEQVEHLVGPLLACRGDPVGGQPADQDGVGAQRDRLDDVAAAADPAVGCPSGWKYPSAPNGAVITGMRSWTPATVVNVEG